MPSFPFGTNAEYAKYLSIPDLAFDVSLTPCKINLFGELFRRQAGIIRSANPILPVAALGPLSKDIISGSHLDELPFASNTSYAKIAKLDAAVVGLGVDLNTNTFVHLIDDAFAGSFPFGLYSESKIECRILDRGKHLDRRSYYYLTPTLRSRIKPRKIHGLLKNCSFYKYEEGTPGFYSLKLGPFIDFGKSLAERSFNNNQLPVWHSL
jgi:hypothetical protein